MPCFHPLQAYRSLTEKTETGKSVLAFDKKLVQNAPHEKITLPCGQCIGCRLDKSLEWSIRCMHEASMHDENCFLTLTYDEMNLPKGGSLAKEDFQKFMKRLRRRFEDRRIRYFHCGEYGKNLERPHYHALLFGFDFPDSVHWTTQNGHKLYRSETLEDLWRHGHSLIGSVTWQSAAYCARYCLKKVTGKKAFDHYVQDVDPETGEIDMIEPEYITMSRRPGIGSEWYEKFRNDTAKDFVTMDGKKFSIPKYYDKLAGEIDELELERVKFMRKKGALKHALNNTGRRLRTREYIQERKMELLKRD